MTLTKDQQRAIHAYKSVESVEKRERASYKVAVNDFGPNIMRTGLAATMALAERKKDGYTTLLKHLASAEIPSLSNDAAQLPSGVRKMNLGDYMLATREILKMVQWLKRAVQAANWPEDDHENSATQRLG